MTRLMKSSINKACIVNFSVYNHSFLVSLQIIYIWQGGKDLIVVYFYTNKMPLYYHAFTLDFEIGVESTGSIITSLKISPTTV